MTFSSTRQHVGMDNTATSLLRFNGQLVAYCGQSGIDKRWFLLEETICHHELIDQTTEISVFQ